MIPARRPTEEIARLAALKDTLALDAGPEREIESLAQVAAIACRTRVALVCLIDDEREVWKATVGASGEGAPRAVAFGPHAILARGTFVVPDAARDPRFEGNPLVTGAPGIRAYAAAPLAGWQGYAFGVLAVADPEPRRFEPRELRALELLARQVTRLIEDTKRREAARGSSVERNALALRGSTDGLWDYHVARREFFLSPALNKLLGKEETEEVMGREAFLALVHTADRPSVESAIEAHLGEGVRYDLEHRVWHASEHWIWVKARGTSVRDSSGKAVRLAGTFVDITRRKNAELALKAERDWSKRLLDECPMIVRCAQGDETVYLNPAGEKLTGYTCEELRGRSWWDVAYDREQVATLFEKWKKGPVRDHEMLLTTRDGSKRTISWTTLSRLSPTGEVVEVISFGHDVTERKKVEADLVAAREAALEASRVKSQFLANMSHEIRTPMNGIMGLTALLLDTDLSLEQRQYLESVESSAETLLALIDDILDLSKIEARKLALEAIPFSVRDAVQGVLRPLQARAKQKGLELLCRIAPEVEDTRRGDPHRLGQVVTNLVGNALKFTTRGSIKVTLERAGDDALSVVVEDSGVGMETLLLKRLFKPFVQADGSTTRKFGGTGLGLAISRELVEMMDGSIEVESAVGKGTTFRVHVKLPVIDASFAPLPKPRGSRTGALSRTRALRVLVAEDNAVNRIVAGRMLEKLGHTVHFAHDGREALAVLSSTPIDVDVALLDIQMPELDGLEVARAVRAREKRDGGHLPIVAVTAHAMQGDRERCLAAGADDYVSKPIAPASLAAALERALGDRSNGASAIRASAAAASKAFTKAHALEMLGGDEELFAIAARAFIRNVPVVEQRLRDAFDGGSAEAIARVGHSLQGSFAQIGASEAASVARAIETAGRAGAVEEARARRGELERELSAVIAVLTGASEPPNESSHPPERDDRGWLRP